MSKLQQVVWSLGFVAFASGLEGCGKSRDSGDPYTGGAGGELFEGSGGDEIDDGGSGGRGMNGTGGRGSSAGTGGKGLNHTGGGPSGGSSAGTGGRSPGAGGAESQPGGMGGTIGDEPVIELVEPADILLDCGDTFVDPGAIATDPEDGSLVVRVVAAPVVVTTVPGKFTITYEVTDSDGNVVSQDRLISVCGPACGTVGTVPIDLSSWTVVQYEFDKQPNSFWRLAEDSLSVLQTVNADASMFISDFDVTDLHIEGTWDIGASTDDDYVGFVFGYRDRGHYYLFDWKRDEQLDVQGFAERGMTVKVVSVPPIGGAIVDPTDEDLWQTTTSEHARIVEVDGVPLNNDVGWEAEKTYVFGLEFHAGSEPPPVSRTPQKAQQCARSDPCPRRKKSADRGASSRVNSKPMSSSCVGANLSARWRSVST